MKYHYILKLGKLLLKELQALCQEGSQTPPSNFRSSSPLNRKEGYWFLETKLLRLFSTDTLVSIKWKCKDMVKMCLC